jgi:hypothetical protein
MILLFLSLAAGLMPVVDYFNYRYVYHVPFAILATGLAILSIIKLSIGITLTTQHRYHREMLGIFRRNFNQDHRSRSK